MSINFANQRFLVLGAGVTGSAVAKSLQARGGIVSIADDNAPDAIKPDAVDLNNFDSVVISPGWRQDHPLVTMVLASNLNILNDIDLAWQIRAEVAPGQKWLALTGTNGKTTVTTLLHQIVSLAGRESGLIGTIETRIGNEVLVSKRTTPESSELQSLAAVMRERHMRNLIMEVSSHSIALDRVRGSHFAVVGFTNLSQDHLDFHQDMESYFKAKASLFTLEYADQAFINIDGDFGLRLFNECGIPATSLSRNNPKASWHFTSITPTIGGTSFTARGAGGILIESSTPLRGYFNLDNILLVLAIAIECGIDPLDCAALIPRLKGAPGRMESVECGQDFIALVDYAHTPDAVEKVLSSLRNPTIKRVIGVLGCGGDRDASKRPLMGRALYEGCDIAIFTSDNPRSEDPEAILKEMTSSISLDAKTKILTDRRAAIAHAVSLAQPGDVVIVLGKGHEKGQEIKGEKLPFSDQEELRRAIEVKS